jgi:hypothetical protein
VALIVMVAMPVAAFAQMFAVPKEQILADQHVLGVLPVMPPLDTPEGENVAALAEARLAACLRSAGFVTHDADAYRVIENDERRAAGGWFDPYTGAINPGVREAVLKRSVDAFRAKHKLGGFARATFEYRSIPFTNARRVIWDGIEEDVLEKEGPMASFRRLLRSPDDGRIPVLSLTLVIYDDRLQERYRASGGVAALATLINSHFAPLDPAAPFEDPARIHRAIDLATAPLSTVPVAPTAVRSTPPDTRRAPNPTTSAAAGKPMRSLPRAEIRKQVKRIALASFDIPDYPLPEVVRTHYEEHLENALVAGGFGVLRSTTVASVMAEAARDVGGVYDAITGKPVPGKRDRATQLARVKLKDQHQVDAFLHASFEIVSAEYSPKGIATWDSVTESIFAPGVKFFEKAYSGRQPAVSLSLRLTDMADRDLYARRAGVALMSVYGGKDFRPRNEQGLLLNETSSRRAVKLALSGLAEDW